MKDLEGRVAIISGSSRGIGRAIALEFARQGARCVLCARSADALQSVVDETATFGAESAYVALDLRDPEAPAKLVGFAVDRYGGIDIVLNNAGATKRAQFLDLTEHDWADGFALKFFGAVRLSRSAWPHLKKAHGSVLNIAGTGGRTPGAAFAVGGSVNAALLSFTKSLAETGIADGVQVNAINPGAVRTGRLHKRLQDLASGRQTGLASAERDFVLAERITRIGEPEDIAGLAAFVAGPRGRFLHGALIDMDGGATKTI